MREHDVDLDGPVGSPSQREHQHEHDDAPPGREVGRGIEAGRPDALGPGGLLHLQQTAGNSGVSALVAQRSAAHDAGDGHDHEGHEGHEGHESGGGAGGEARSPVTDVVSSSGRPLDPGVRSSMESALGHDFSDVQVHSDAQAAASAKSVQAQAYTVGNHVVFGEGRYQPETSEGRRTLAHELTHVVQQRQGPVDGTPAAGGIKVSDPSDRFEREAESVADRVMSGSSSDAAPVSGGAAAVQRHEEPGAEEAPVQRQAAPEEDKEEAPPEAGAEPAPPAEAPPSETPAPEAAEEGAPEGSPEAAPPAEESEEEAPAGP